MRAALLLVERGEAPARHRLCAPTPRSPKASRSPAPFPTDSHEPITYPFAVPRAGDTPEARALLDFLAGPEGTAAFRKRGFTTEAD